MSPLILILLGLTALYVGGELLVKAAIGFGLRSGLSTMVIGLTLVAFGTSAPELAVSLDAALLGSSDIALANVVGSNMANIALVLALTVLMKPMAIDSITLKRDLPVMLVAFLFFTLLLHDRSLDRVDGILLIAALVIYVFYVVTHPSGQVDIETDEKNQTLFALSVFFVAGIAFLALGGHWLVAGAIVVAKQLGVSEAVIGLTVVAIGTSLPEITASVIATVRGHAGLALGNVVGSNIWNSFLVLGTTASITPVTAQSLSWHMLLVMIFVGMLLWVFCRSRYTLSRLEGVVLLSIFVAYQGFLFT